MNKGLPDEYLNKSFPHLVLYRLPDDFTRIIGFDTVEHMVYEIRMGESVFGAPKEIVALNKVDKAMLDRIELIETYRKN